MKMIYVLDKICLIGVIGVSFYAGYKVGLKNAKGKEPQQVEIINFTAETKKGGANNE